MHKPETFLQPQWGQWVKQECYVREWTFKEAADKSGLGDSTIRGWVSGNRINIASASKLEAAFIKYPRKYIPVDEIENFREGTVAVLREIELLKERKHGKPRKAPA